MAGSEPVGDDFAFFVELQALIVRKRWISEQVKARWMLHALDQGAIEGVMDVTRD